MRAMCVVLLMLLAVPAMAQQAPALTAILTDAEQSVTDAEKALALAAPEAYKALTTAIKVRNGLRARIQAETKPVAKVEPEKK